MAARLPLPAPAPLRAKPVAGPRHDVSPPSAPLVRGKPLRSTVRRAGAIAATEALREAMASGSVTQQFLAAVLEVDQSWVHDLVTGRSAVLLGDIFKAPKSIRQAIALRLLQSAETDNTHR